jgi:hypothetical protein
MKRLALSAQSAAFLWIAAAKVRRPAIFAAVMFLGTTVAWAASNPASDRLMALSSDRQAYTLGQLVGDGCTGKDAFYMGVEESSGAALWSVRCLDSREFSVMMEPDSDDTQVLGCQLLTQATHVECFKPFQQ